MKQLLIYFVGLVGMKLFVWFLFAALPWLPWVGDWALRWTEGNEALQIAFSMFVFPLAMNAVQYWVIDSFIMDKKGKREGSAEQGEYERVGSQEDDDERGDEDGSFTEVEEVDSQRPIPKVMDEANPTPVPAGSGNERMKGSASSSPLKSD